MIPWTIIGAPVTILSIFVTVGALLVRSYPELLPKHTDLSLSPAANGEAYLRQGRDAWTLKGTFRASETTDVEPRIKDVSLTDLTLVTNRSGEPSEAYSVDLTRFRPECQGPRLLKEEYRIPATKDGDGYRRVTNDMRYGIRYLFERDDEFEENAAGFKEMRMTVTITVKVEGGKPRERSVTMCGPIQHEWHFPEYGPDSF